MVFGTDNKIINKSKDFIYGVEGIYIHVCNPLEEIIIKTNNHGYTLPF